MSEMLTPHPDYLTHIDTMIDAYGLNPDNAAIGAEWGHAWWRAVNHLPPESITPTVLEQLREQSIDNLPVPRDTTEHRPAFRVAFAAQESFYLAAGEYGDTLRAYIEGNGPRVIPHFDKIDAVFTTLLDSYDRNLYPFNLDSTRVPQDPRHMPRNLSLNIETCTEEQKIKLASFWFADCYYMRAMNDSNDMTINLAKLHEDHPELFDFSIAAAQSPETIEKTLLQYHLPVNRVQISYAWVENARRMMERYDGDPRKIFDDFGTYNELVSRTANDKKGSGFVGFQKKMTSMLGYYYMALGLIPYQNIPLPVDFHVMRMALSQELITFEDIPDGTVPFEKTTDMLRAITFDYADRHDVSQLDLCDVLWLYSREACVHSPTNSQEIIGKRQGRRTTWAPILDDAAHATTRQTSDYEQSCGICRLKGSCRHNVPSGPYYVSGTIKWPNPKVHLDMQDTLYAPETLAQAQHPTTTVSPSVHEVDRRDNNRDEMAERRIATIRELTQRALFPLTPAEEAQIARTIISSDGNPTASLSGKKFGFTDQEIMLALGENPDFDTLAAIKPYRAT